MLDEEKYVQSRRQFRKEADGKATRTRQFKRRFTPRMFGVTRDLGAYLDSFCDIVSVWCLWCLLLMCSDSSVSVPLRSYPLVFGFFSLLMGKVKKWSGPSEGATKVPLNALVLCPSINPEQVLAQFTHNQYEGSQ